MTVLVVLMGLDILTGMCAAFKMQELSSSVSFSGMLKKVAILAIVAAGVCMELISDILPWPKLISLFYSVSEFLSILENASKMGVPLPVRLVKALEKVKTTVGAEREQDESKLP